MKIVPFIFNWPGQFENTVRSQADLEKCFDRVQVINSDASVRQSGWVNLGNEAFFSAQFLKAIDLFDGDVLFHLQADASYHDWPSVFDRAVDAYRRYQWGIFAPNVDWTAWKSPAIDIPFEPLEGTGLNLVACTDCTCWMINREIIDYFRGKRDLFHGSKFGWGIDVTMAGISYILGRPVLRDMQHVVQHPKGRGYDTAGARSEYDAFLENLDPDLKAVISAVTEDRRKLLDYLGSP